MIISGCNLLGSKKSDAGSKTFNVLNPQSGKRLKPFFYEATKEEIKDAATLASKTFCVYSKTSYSDRAKFLEAIADEILISGNKLIQRCHIETALPIMRLEGERERTVNQLRMFASLLRDGSWLHASIDKDKKTNTDIRLTQIPLGPVAVFGASNFPFAFSVAGGDTASALAAGCPVIVKANPLHPGTSEMVGNAILKAVEKMNFPEGTFSLLQGQSHMVGLELVSNNQIKAVGFTGSFKGGKDLFKAANARTEPIPVYAEMGSTNPVFLFPEALKNNAKLIAKNLVDSVTLGVGQFCTNPGLVFYVDDGNAKDFEQAVIASFKKAPSGTMLSEQVKLNYEKGLKEISTIKDLELLAQGKLDKGDCEASAQLFKTDFNTFKNKHRLEEEVFGPSTVLVAVKDIQDFSEAAEYLGGHLSISLHAETEELHTYKNFIDIVQNKAGRIVYNEFPTGVTVCPSMHHGGPFPATTNIRYTSVGTRAIYRFVRPVSFQNTPNEFLPDELKNENPLHIYRTINGKLSSEKLE